MGRKPRSRYWWIVTKPQTRKPAATKAKAAAKSEPAKETNKAPAKQRQKFVVEAVSLLASDSSEGKVGLGPLGQYLKRTDPAFSPKT